MTGDEVRRSEFREAYRGYNAQHVDTFLEKVADALDAGISISALVQSVEFGRSLRGYGIDDVDAVLVRLRFQS
jgi:DivIVA domain-containing protein